MDEEVKCAACKSKRKGLWSDTVAHYINLFKIGNQVTSKKLIIKNRQKTCITSELQLCEVGPAHSCYSACGFLAPPIILFIWHTPGNIVESNLLSSVCWNVAMLL